MYDMLMKMSYISRTSNKVAFSSMDTRRVEAVASSPWKTNFKLRRGSSLAGEILVVKQDRRYSPPHLKLKNIFISSLSESFPSTILLNRFFVNLPRIILKYEYLGTR